MIGKMIYLWKGRHCAGGDLGKTVAECKRLGLRAVALKIADAVYERYASYPDDMEGAVKAFKAAGMKVWGWQYIYGGIVMNRSGQVLSTNGARPEAEAECALYECRRLGLDGYIIDAEQEYKVMAQAERAKRFMARLAALEVPVALSSYRFPSLHPEFPWGEFLRGCDLHMPQVYWGRGRAESDLDRSMQELKAIRALPITPVGRAYTGDGHAGFAASGTDLIPDEIRSFMRRAQDTGCPGVSFWSLDHLYLHSGGPGRADAITEFTWVLPEEGSPQGEAEQPGPGSSGYPIVEIIAVNYLNVRDAPEGRDLGDLKAGLRFYVFEERQSGGYTWGRIGEKAWVALGKGRAEFRSQE